jgi:metal-responsive CopG/Arc/MetJ family transcriptional regulator
MLLHGGLTWVDRALIISGMQRITISLPRQLAETVKREARRQRLPVSEIVRQSLSARFEDADSKPRTLRFAGIGRSHCTDTSDRVEEILAQEWATPSWEKHDK